YYHGRGHIFDALVDLLSDRPDVFVVYLPRVAQQAHVAQRLPPDRVLVPHRALDGPDLVAAADAVISGGGTMLREAAVLGTPGYSIFEGKIGAVDAMFAREGRLRLLAVRSDVSSLCLEAKRSSTRRSSEPGLVGRVTDAVLGG